VPLPARTFSRRTREASFTLAEILVAVAILCLLVGLLAQLLSNTSRAVSSSTNHLEADDRARLLFARMAADFSRAVRRADVDYYLKSPSVAQTGNDRLAFYSEVAGYSSSGLAQNSVSLVAYRVRTVGETTSVERMGKALSWDGASGSTSPVVFLPLTIAETWPAATNDNDDTSFEAIAPNVFRLEYYYMLRDGTTGATPWNAASGSTSVNGLKDIAAIGVVIAAADRKAAQAAQPGELPALGAALPDFSPGAKVGALQARWQQALLDGSVRPALREGVHVYEHLFYIGSFGP